MQKRMYGFEVGHACVWRGLVVSLLLFLALVAIGVAALGNGQGVYVVHASAGPNGSIRPSGDILVSEWERQTFRMSPAPGYHVADVLVNGVSVGAVRSYTFSGLDSDAAISVTFAEDAYTIYASSRGLGSISPRRGIDVPTGADQVFTIAPLPGCIVIGVQVDGRSVGAVTSYTFRNVRRPHTIRAIFGPAPNMITASADGNGTIFPSGRITASASGESQRFIMMPADHYHVSDVLVDGVSVGAVTSYVFANIMGQHTIHAAFVVDENPITTIVEGNGSIGPSGVVAVGYGGSTTFDMTAADGHHVADVQVDGVSVGAVCRYTFSDVTSPHVIAVRFSVDGTRRIVTEAGVGGTIAPTSETAVLVMNGNNKTFAILPERHHDIADVQVDGVSVGPVETYTFTNVIADHTITASFVAETVTIAASTGANGSISPEGDVPVPYGGSQVFAMSASQGYAVADVFIDGQSVGARDEWVFNSVTRSHTIRVTFTRAEYGDGADGAHRSM